MNNNDAISRLEAENNRLATALKSALDAMQPVADSFFQRTMSADNQLHLKDLTFGMVRELAETYRTLTMPAADITAHDFNWATVSEPSKQCAVCGHSEGDIIHRPNWVGLSSHKFEPDDHVAFLRYHNGTISICDSRSPGAFRVYKHKQPNPVAPSMADLRREAAHDELLTANFPVDDAGCWICPDCGNHFAIQDGTRVLTRSMTCTCPQKPKLITVMRSLPHSERKAFLKAVQEMDRLRAGELRSLKARPEAYCMRGHNIQKGCNYRVGHSGPCSFEEY